ncbi:MAG: arsenite-transporting ATPase [Bacteriovoracaceae bacterium]|jgi:arsenite-transporting ATPase
MALTKTLKEQGIKAEYNSFDVSPRFETLTALGIPHFELFLEQSMKEYMGRKLKSEMVAGWIMKTPFFSSLFNMLPALSQMILLGHIIDKLNADPSLHIVIDAPASGHCLTLFQSTHNFKDMFKDGLLVEDINKMHAFLHTPGNLEIWITTLPSRMAIQEGAELGEKLSSMNIDNIKFLANGNLSQVPYIKNKDAELPEFLRQKVTMEDEALSDISDLTDSKIGVLPYFTDIKFENIVNSANKYLQGDFKWS